MMSISHTLFKKKVARSVGGDIVLVLFLALMGLLMILPFVYTISTSLKPANELWLFPPRFFVIKPTMKNFGDLFSLMSDSWIPFSRYIFNTVFITAGRNAAAYRIGLYVCLSVVAVSVPGLPLYFFRHPNHAYV